MSNNDFTVLVSRGGRCCWVSMWTVWPLPYKMNERVEQLTYIKFCIKPEYPSPKTIQVIQKAADIGNWWLIASSQQCTWSYITSQAEFCGETSNHPGNSGSIQLRFGALRPLAFSKTKITFEREEISDHQWDSGK